MISKGFEVRTIRPTKFGQILVFILNFWNPAFTHVPCPGRRITACSCKHVSLNYFYRQVQS